MAEETNNADTEKGLHGIEPDSKRLELVRELPSRSRSTTKSRFPRNSVALSVVAGLSFGTFVGVFAFTMHPLREKSAPNHEATKSLLPISDNDVELTLAQAVVQPTEEAQGGSQMSSGPDAQRAIQALEDRLTALSKEVDQLKEVRAQLVQNGAALDELKRAQLQTARDYAALTEQFKESQEQLSYLVARSKTEQARPLRVGSTRGLSPPVTAVPGTGNPPGPQAEPTSPRPRFRAPVRPPQPTNP